MTPDFQELKALIMLNRLFAGGGARRVVLLLREGAVPVEILQRIESEDLFGKAAALAEARKTFYPEAEFERADSQNIRCLSFLDPEYPKLLKETSDPPILLYQKGRFIETDEAACAMVGSRHPSFYGLMQAKRFAAEIAREGLSVVSGLAQGIDHAAHEAALSISYGRTIAVLGCGIDVVYPASSRKIYDQISERGVLLSEYPLGSKPLAHHFPARNRIIAGLSLGVLVVEAHSRSGSLITAREATEEGREVFALPGPVDQLTSKGTHRLIKEGAALVEDPRDIFEILEPALWPVLLKGRAKTETKSVTENVEPVLVSAEEKVLLEVLQKGPLALDEIMNEARLRPGVLMPLMTNLELHRKIRKTPEGRFQITTNP